MRGRLRRLLISRKESGIALWRAARHPRRDDEYLFLSEALIGRQVAESFHGPPRGHRASQYLLLNINRPGPNLLVRGERIEEFAPWHETQRRAKIRETSRAYVSFVVMMSCAASGITGSMKSAAIESNDLRLPVSFVEFLGTTKIPQD